jgi:hypothetical protein
MKKERARKRRLSDLSVSSVAAATDAPVVATAAKSERERERKVSITKLEGGVGSLKWMEGKKDINKEGRKEERSESAWKAISPIVDRGLIVVYHITRRYAYLYYLYFELASTKARYTHRSNTGKFLVSDNGAHRLRRRTEHHVPLYELIVRQTVWHRTVQRGG